MREAAMEMPPAGNKALKTTLTQLTCIAISAVRFRLSTGVAAQATVSGMAQRGKKRAPAV